MDQTILVCKCVYANILGQKPTQLISSLTSRNIRIFVLDDLCLAATVKDKSLVELIQNNSVTIVACHKRAVKALLHFAGIDLNRAELKFVDLRAETIESALLAVKECESSLTRADVVNYNNQSSNGWYPWFPVIDSERCTNCKQCLNFCLFNVFGLDDSDHVKVINPQNCKTNCPACARICSGVAIIFPKYTSSPINGSEIIDEELEKQRVKLDMEKILGSDPQQMLKRRSLAKRVKLFSQDVSKKTGSDHFPNIR